MHNCRMPRTVQIGALPPAGDSGACAQNVRTAVVFWLQGVTIAWMLVEFAVSAYAAVAACSPALAAFGADSLVELLSASVVLLQSVPGITISARKATRATAFLLFVLAVVVAVAAVGSIALHRRPETSGAGIAITIAALIAMPVIAALKRREARRSGNAALAADAVQSATCAYLALITLAGLAVNAVFHIPWFDSAAALVAVPFLVKEGMSAWKGQVCGCC
jgi:divalent metal cation (Fe/Co/Zn/Cd) transporter